MADVPLMENPMTTSGDVIYGGASGTPTRLAVGTNGHVLTLAAGVPSWAAASGASLGAWTTYTPTWTTSGTAPSLGNGTLAGRYKALDANTYLIKVLLLIGSTTTVGTGGMRFAMPPGVSSAALQVISGAVNDQGTRYFTASGIIGNTATVIGPIVTADGSSTHEVAAGIPITWAVNDYLILEGMIEAA